MGNVEMKTVTIWNHDGSKYDVRAPDEAKYLGIFPHSGNIRFYWGKPGLQADNYYDDRLVIDETYSFNCVCPHENLPCFDGYGYNGKPNELLLKIEEV